LQLSLRQALQPFLQGHKQKQQAHGDQSISHTEQVVDHDLLSRTSMTCFS
jgi:hypothetical protein